MDWNLESVRHLLESRLQEATQREGSWEAIRIQQVADPIDMTLQSAESEMAVQSLDRQASLVLWFAKIMAHPKLLRVSRK